MSDLVVAVPLYLDIYNLI